MQIQMTADELIDKGVWDEVCNILGWNPWIVNEGLMDSDEYITLSGEQAKRLGLLK